MIELKKGAFNEIVGLTPQQAEALLAGQQINIVRPVKEDGGYLIVTRDLRTDRLNVELVDGVISAVLGVG